MEVYQKLLSRDMEVVTVFSHAITIFDNIRITPPILSSIEPIAIYNQQITRWTVVFIDSPEQHRTGRAPRRYSVRSAAESSSLLTKALGKVADTRSLRIIASSVVRQLPTDTLK